MDAETIPLVNVTEAAKALGVHKSTISRQIRDHIIPNRGTIAAPMVNVDEARQARARGLDRSKQRGPDSPLFSAASAIGSDAETADEAAPPPPDGRAPAPSGAVDYQRARTAREGFQARLSQIELEQKLGNLLDKGEVVDAFFALGATLRELMETRRGAISGRLAGITDPAAIAVILAEEDRKFQDSIAAEFERRFTVGASVAA